MLSNVVSDGTEKIPSIALIQNLLNDSVNHKKEIKSENITEFNLNEVWGTEWYKVNGKDVSELSDVCYLDRGTPYMNSKQAVRFKSPVYTNQTVKM